MNITVKSPANIAFIKYWGQKNTECTLPYHDSFSMNLSGCFVEIDCQFSTNLKKHELLIQGYKEDYPNVALPEQYQRLADYYHKIKKYFNQSTDVGFTMTSRISFPMKAGIASSAAFFSAVAMAFATYYGKSTHTKELSRIARLSGSGSATRSIPDGFVWWYAGNDHESSFAESIAPPDYWDIRDIVIITSRDHKQISSDKGHEQASTSPFFKKRVSYIKQKTIPQVKKAFSDKDFTRFGQLIEHEALYMHHIMMTQKTPLYYWNEKTISLLRHIAALRDNGIEAYATIDAGHNIHCICEAKNEEVIVSSLDQLAGIEDYIVNKPTFGTRSINLY